MRIVGLDHLQLAIPAGGEAAARDFYGNLLRLTEVAKPAPLASRGGIWFAGAGLQLHLGVMAPTYSPSTKGHPAFLVADLEAARTRLEAAGVAVQPDDAVTGRRRFYAADPFGNRLEFIQHGDGFNPAAA